MVLKILISTLGKYIPELLIASALIIIGFILFVVFGKKQNEIDKYEFENRTSGGVVNYESYEESQKMTNRKTFTKVFSSLGCISFVIGLIIIMMVITTVYF